MPSRKEINVIEEAFDVREDWFEEGIGSVQARVSSGNQSNFPIDQINVDEI